MTDHHTLAASLNPTPIWTFESRAV